MTLLLIIPAVWILTIAFVVAVCAAAALGDAHRRRRAHEPAQPEQHSGARAIASA